MVSDNDNWRARDDMDTLRRAEEIKADKKRYSGAQKQAAKNIEHMSKIAKPTSKKPVPKKPSPKPTTSRRRGK